MREVLLQLALTSNGRTASYDSSGGGQADHTPSLGFGDAPALHFARLWDEADDDDARARVLEQAQEALQHVRKSSGDPTRVESKAQRDARIIEQGQGIEARDVAVWARCGVTDVRKAREAASRDPDYGRPIRDVEEEDRLRGDVARGG
jgi:hypothetical protein